MNGFGRKVPHWTGAVFVCLHLACIGAYAQPCRGPEAAGGAPGPVLGRVLDPSSGAVPGAVVAIGCLGTRREATTDAEGRFSIAMPPGSYHLRVQRDGFAPKLVLVEVAAAKPSDIGDLQLALSEASDAVTVTAGGFEQLVRNAPASVSVLPREELQEKRYASLAQALVDVEGVDVQQDVGKTGGQTISMRGMPSDYTLMLIDGKRQNSPGSVTPNGFGETATSFMPPIGAIERIEVVRGPMSTLYGSDAMGGVVNVITRKVSNDWTGTITLDGTAQQNRDYGDTANGNFYLTGPLWKKRLGLALRGGAFHRQAAALRYERIDGQEVPITSFGFSPTKSNIWNLGGRLSYLATENNEFYFDFDDMRQVYDNRQNQLGTATLQGGYAPEMTFNRRQYLLSHQGRYRFGIWDNSLTRNNTFTNGRTIPPNTPGRIAGDPRTLDASNTLLDSKLITAIGRHTLSTGGQFWDANMVDAVAPNPYNFKQSALFAEDEWRILNKLSATMGARYDYHNTFGGKVSPRGYLVYSPTPILTLKGGVSRGFKTPQLNQLATGIVGFGGQGTIPLIGSPGLKPETSTSTEFGGSLLVRGVNFSVTLFNNEFQNKIASGPGLENCSFRLSPDRPGCTDFGNWPNVDLFGQQINVDEAVTRGIETAMRFRFLKRFDVRNNYTYTASQQRSGAQAGQPLVNTPKHMYNANIRYAATDKLSTWLRIEARSNRTRGTSAAALAATQQLGPFEGYGMAHLGVSYQLTKTLVLNGTVYNLLDTNFLTYRPYIVNNATQYASVYNNLQEPRRFWLSVTYSF